MEQEIKRNIPRDLFLHLLAIVTLYWSAVSFVTILWQMINYFFQDQLNYFYYDNFSGLIRFGVSSLFIVFPVFIIVSWYLNKIYTRESQVRESKIRKWLIYLTLFIASLIIIGDLVTIINMLLGGEVTIRFILKALSVLLVAGFVFGYYLDDVRKDAPTKLAKPFAWASGVLVVAAIAGAFFVIGSPTTARLFQFDQQKVSDLQGIQSQIVNYWQKKEALPNSLSDLNDPISSFNVPVDPQTNKAYEYTVKDAQKLSFELCATFNKEGADQYGQARPTSIPVKGFTSDNWQHSSGRVCFERTIDKQLYPPLNTQTTK
jgi:hypothetical protein